LTTSGVRSIRVSKSPSTSLPIVANAKTARVMVSGMAVEPLFAESGHMAFQFAAPAPSLKQVSGPWSIVKSFQFSVFSFQ
jgi:hypothetical protein